MVILSSEGNLNVTNPDLSAPQSHWILRIFPIFCSVTLVHSFHPQNCLIVLDDCLSSTHDIWIPDRQERGKVKRHVLLTNFPKGAIHSISPPSVTNVTTETFPTALADWHLVFGFLITTPHSPIWSSATYGMHWRKVHHGVRTRCKPPCYSTPIFSRLLVNFCR